jgi:hypothetical protein
MAERSEVVAVRLSLVKCVESIGTVKVSASQLAPEMEREKFSFSLSLRSASGPKMHLQSLHALRQRGPLLTVIISCLCKVFL